MPRIAPPAAVPDEPSRSPSVLAFERPARRPPTARAHRLQVALVWNDRHLLDVVEADPGEALTIGATPDADLHVFHAATARRARPLARVNDDATCTLWIPSESSASVHLDGREHAVTDLIERGRGTFVDLPSAGVEVRLGLNDRASVAFDRVRILVRFSRPTTSRPRFDAGFVMRVIWYVAGALGVWAAQEVAFTPAEGVLVEAQAVVAGTP